MTATPKESTLNSPEPSRRTLAEASAWLARLHRPQRMQEDEAGFRRWLGERPEHARAWELASEMWETAQSIPLSAMTPPAPVRERHKWRPRGRLFVTMTAVAASLIAAILFQWSPPDEPMATNVGEQRVVTLEDGSRVSMNTSTRVSILFTPETRRVHLLEGEALFEVTKNKQRPFIVQVNDREITALGTSFVVRRDPTRFEVTLVEGQIAVAPIPGLEKLLDEIPPPQILKPGERLTFNTEEEKATVDRPALDRVIAWQRGVAIFDNTPLVDAAMEMNRYSRATYLSVEGGDVGRLPVSGVFRVGDSASFARAVSQGYNLNMREEEGRIVLSSGASMNPKRPQ